MARQNGINSSLSSLVTNLVPNARHNDRLRAEILEDAQQILNSHIGSSRQTDIGHLSSLIRRQLTASESLRFSNLLARLLDQDLLTRKHAALQFLNAVSGASSHPPPIIPSLITPVSARSPNPQSPRPRSPLPPDPNRPAAVKTKAQLLRDYRERNGSPHLPEHILLRDVLYIFQGISGKYIKFSESGRGQDSVTVQFHEDGRYIISHPTRALVIRLSELGHLQMRVSNWVQEQEGRTGAGMIEQSLRHHLQTQLTEYYRFIAVLESQMTHTSSNDLDGGRPSGIREEETGLTLRRLEVWISDWRLRMRMMSVCVEGCQDSQGGALVSLIHNYTRNGDPFIRNSTKQLLEEVSKPFFVTLHRWLFSGELYDPHSEFFVSANPELAHLQYVHAHARGGMLAGDVGFAAGDDDGRVDEPQHGLKLWQEKYLFRKEMLPSFVEDSFGRKIFSTGKSLNFIRYSCHDSDWVETRHKLNNSGDTLKYSDIPGLKQSIDSAYKIASQRLFDILIDKFKLLDHLKALKHYLLLGHGDFAEQLMESLLPSLSRPANTLYRHNLTATLETAIRSSNARDDPPDVIRRLDARVLEYSHGEIGWDCFTLEYKVDAPIDTVVDPASMDKYLKLFNHLWKMKRVEAALSTTWSRIRVGPRSFMVSKGAGSVSGGMEELEAQWHQIRIVLAEMIHFMRQLQAYCQLAVIECSWKELMDFVQKKRGDSDAPVQVQAKEEGDLDALIQAHTNYLDRMVRKVLLMSPKAGREEHLLTHLREMFNNILQFRDATDTLYHFSISEASRLDSPVKNGFTSPEPDSLFATLKPSGENLPRILRRIKEYSGLFSERAQSITHSLQTHPDPDCKALAQQLNFSEFYRSRREIKEALNQTVSGKS